WHGWEWPKVDKPRYQHEMSWEIKYGRGGVPLTLTLSPQNLGKITKSDLFGEKLIFLMGLERFGTLWQGAECLHHQYILRSDVETLCSLPESAKRITQEDRVCWPQSHFLVKKVIFLMGLIRLALLGREQSVSTSRSKYILMISMRRQKV